jgi:Fe-S cluster assembly protein SufD
MIATTDQTDTALTACRRLFDQTVTTGAGWFEQRRRDAFARFSQLGLPTTKCEDWCFTNIAPLRRTDFLAPDTNTTVTESDLQPFEIDQLGGIRLVFVNGRYCASLSQFPEGQPPAPGSRAGGVKVITLADAFDSAEPLLKAHLAKLPDIPQQAFTELNTALAHDGVVVHVPANLTVAEPIRIVHLTPPTDQPTLTNLRNLIVAEQGASVTVIEDFVSLRRDVYFTNVVTQVIVGENANVNHYMLQRGSTRAYHVSALHVNQKQDSHFASHSALLGGQIVRNNVYPVLDGSGCESILNGLYVLDGDQIADNHMRVEHAKPHGQSHQFYRGIISGKAKGIFRGRIVVCIDAQKTDAKQSNQNLLLSDDASVNTDPQLEIYADDVKCTHGATVGRINADQVFYLMARGISRATAQAMITHAFAGESLKRMSNEAVRNMLRCSLVTRLPQVDVMEPV